MVKCNSYHITEETRYLTEFEQGFRFAKTGKRITKEKVKVAHCWGTKDCEECKCEGDRRKCDFYPENRKPKNVAKCEKEHAPKFGEWISVEDDLPPINEWVIVYPALLPKTDRAMAYRDDNGMFTDDYYDFLGVTHWTPFPEPPKEG